MSFKKTTSFPKKFGSTTSMEHLDYPQQSAPNAPKKKFGSSTSMELLDSPPRIAPNVPKKKFGSTTSMELLDSPPRIAPNVPKKKFGSTTSMELLDSRQQISQNVPKRSYSIEFPTSPHPSDSGEQIIHSGHPQHPLSHLELPDLYKCSGCKEYGSGKRFSCRQCEFQLHEFCALAPPALKAHPFHIQHQLLFSPKPVKGGIRKPKCAVCGKTTKGYRFRCNTCSFQMHPCCAMLSNEISLSIHPHSLKILPVAAANEDPGFVCGACNRKRSGRGYQCCVCDYHLHAVCAKDMVNGLQANGKKAPEKPSMLGTAVRLASQVVGEFIGGIVDGLGQGVGEVIIQSLSRGNGVRRSVNNNHN